MEMIEAVRRLWEHARWADSKLLEVLRTHADRAPQALHEYAHILGVEEVWLARIERRSRRAAVWPAVSLAEVESLFEKTHAAYETALAGLKDADLDGAVTYTNSAGQTFTNSVGDILLHVALHGQYHRGKVNLLLRQVGCPPVPTDHIAFVRGAPAASTRRDPDIG